jgi:hypothetical protein
LRPPANGATDKTNTQTVVKPSPSPQQPNITTSTANPSAANNEAKKAPRLKKKRRPQLDLLLERSSDMLKAAAQHTKQALTWSHDLLLVDYMPILEGLLTLSAAAQDSEWGERLNSASQALHLNRSNEGVPDGIPLIKVAGLMLVSALLGYTLSRLLRPRPKHETVHWLHTWWTKHPPHLNSHKLQEALARQLNDYLRSSTGVSSQNVAKVRGKETGVGD